MVRLSTFDGFHGREDGGAEDYLSQILNQIHHAVGHNLARASLHISQRPIALAGASIRNKWCWHLSTPMARQPGNTRLTCHRDVIMRDHPGRVYGKYLEAMTERHWLLALEQ